MKSNGQPVKKSEMIALLKSDVSGSGWHKYVQTENLIGADLSCAKLSDADLRGADLSCADLSDADLRWSNIRGANLIGADLSCAKLSDEDLRWSNLHGANLSGADLSGAVGNLKEIRSIHCFERVITYSADRMWIGDRSHTLEEWWSFDDDQAIECWTKWKPLLQQIITAFPATPITVQP